MSGRMDDLEKKLSVLETESPHEQVEEEEKPSRNDSASSETTIGLLRRFLSVQQRRAFAYARLKRGFEDYMISGGELIFQQLCSEVTAEFNDCSKQVLKIESLFASPDSCREDLAGLLRSVQAQEKEKLHLTATIQLLKKAGHPSERLISHEKCRFGQSAGHECVHIQQITEASGTEEAEADAQYDNALKEAMKGVQDSVLAINEYLEEIRYEIAEMEAE